MSLVWHGDDVIAQIENASDDAALTGARVLLQLANQTVPFEVGTLEQSGKAELSGSGEAQVSYNTIYARPQHERLDYTHKGKGRAKWLELTMTEESATILGAIANKLKAVI